MKKRLSIKYCSLLLACILTLSMSTFAQAAAAGTDTCDTQESIVSVPAMLQDTPRTGITSLAELKTAITDASVGDTIVIENDIVLTTAEGEILINKSLIFQAVGNSPVTLKIDEDNNSLIRHMNVSGSNTTLTFDGVILDGSANGGGVRSTTGTNLTLVGAEIQNCAGGTYGGGIYLSNNGDLSLVNTTVRSCTAGNGGGVYARGNIAITGGAISDNQAISPSASYGGGVYMVYNTTKTGQALTLSGGAVISGNKTHVTNTTGSRLSDGGGIYVQNASAARFITVSVSDGAKINGNQSQNTGGGIQIGQYNILNINGNTVEINDNSIIDGVTNGNTYGGGIFGDSVSKINMISGTIRGNTATNGGGIHTTYTTVVTISGGEIIGNTATALGGGIYAYSTSTVILKDDARIIGNTATNVTKTANGGGVAGQIIQISGDAEISGNTADANGGGVHALFANNEITISGNAKITGNTAGKDGGGISCTPSGSPGTITIKDNVQVTGNLADRNGGGIYGQPSTTTYSVSIDLSDNVIITGNESKGAAAGEGGGAIYTSKRETLTVGTGVIFGDNKAVTGRKWTVTDATADGRLHIANIHTNSFTAPFTNAYNNFDVNYPTGDIVYAVTVNYYKDAVDSAGFIDKKLFAHEVGLLYPEDVAAALNDPNWLNTFQPDHYQDGKLVDDAFPLSVTAVGAVLNVLYEPIVFYTVTYDGNGNTGGTAPIDHNSPYAEDARVTVLGNTGNLVKTNHTFASWNTEADGQGTSYTAGDIFTINGDTTFYVLWNYTGDDGGVAPQPEPEPTPNPETQPNPTPNPEPKPTPTPKPPVTTPPVGSHKPVPPKGTTLILGNNNSYELIDENGVPLGKYTLNNESVWIYDEYPPLAKNPSTGGSSQVTFALFGASFIVCGFCIRLRKNNNREF